MKVAVTGGTGVVGTALVAALVAEGHDVSALVREGSAPHPDVRPVRGDLLDPESIDHLTNGAEVVFNVAGVNELCPRRPDIMWQVNVVGTRNVLQSALRSGVRRVVHTSSAVTIGEAKGEVGTERTVHGGRHLSHYARTKTEAERLALAFEGLEVVAVNPSSVQGPGRATGTGKILLASARGRLRLAVDTVFSLVDIEDCARGHILAASRGEPGERYILSGATLSTARAIEVLELVMGPLPRPTFLPDWVLPVAGAIGSLLPLPVPVCAESVRVARHGHRLDGSRATRELGLTYTPIEETFRRTVDWFRESGLL